MNPILWLAGVHRDVLRRCRSDRAKYLGIGSAVLITAAIAGVSMTFALHTALEIKLHDAIPVAVAWGLAIMSLDRWLVVSLVRQPNKRQYLLLAAPRFFLGLLFGFIISTPITLQIFAPEIDRQVSVIQHQDAEAYYAAQRNGALAKTVAADQTAVNNLQAAISSGGGAGQNPANNPQIKSLMAERATEIKTASTDYNQWQCQLYGHPGNCRPGNGPLAKASGKRYANDETLINGYTTQINNLTQSIQHQNTSAKSKALSDAYKALPGAQTKLQQDEGNEQKLKAEFNHTNTSKGILIRLQALNQVSSQSASLNAARWLLFAFFTTIECLPVLVKVLLNLSPENTYEKALNTEARLELRNSEQESLRLYQRKLREAEARSTWEARATRAKRRVFQARLTAWEKQELRRDPETTVSELPGWPRVRPLARWHPARARPAWTMLSSRLGELWRPGRGVSRALYYARSDDGS